jgi:hypothetical protein
MTTLAQSGETRPQQNLWKHLLAAAIRAPSGDNCQPWQFRLDDNRLYIDIVPERAKSFFDYRHRATFLAVGAAVENIRVAAAGAGHGIEVAYAGGTQPGEAAATVTLRPDHREAVPGRQRAMLERTVNRRPFFAVRPSSAKRDVLLADAVPHTEIRWFDSRKDIRAWARLIYLADRIRYSHPGIHREVFAKILATRDEIERVRMGLEFDRLGIGPAATAVLKLLKPWERMKKLSRFKIDAALSMQSRMLMLSSGAVVLVSIPGNDREDWMRAGEQIERLWIGAHALGLCTHPMTVVLYLYERYKEEGMKNFLPKHREILEAIERELPPLLGDRVGAMVFRIGYGWKMSKPAVRMPLDRFIHRGLHLE